jgi:hypothetical protein
VPGFKTTGEFWRKTEETNLIIISNGSQNKLKAFSYRLEIISYL